jgi:phytoene dehydrogenase-like protein
LYRSVEQTAAGLGRDGGRWRLLFDRPSRTFDKLSDDIMGPLLRIPQHPLTLARFGPPTLLPAATTARLFRTEQAQALFGGVAAHTFRPLQLPMTTAVGLGIITAGHRHGWPVAAGGSQAITDAMATLAGILGDGLSRRVAREYRRFRRGQGAFKVDFAVEGGVPWTNGDARRAGTVHVGGSFAESAATERDVHAGRMPQRPFVLVGQPYLADPTRSVGNIHPVWTYAHVPNGFTGDATAAIVAQIERFAPGFQDRVVGQAASTTAQIAAENRNFVGGDIMTGAKDIRQLVFGLESPCRLPHWSAGQLHLLGGHPAGARAHGMCGASAAELALGDLAR